MPVLPFSIRIVPNQLLLVRQNHPTAAALAYDALRQDLTRRCTRRVVARRVTGAMIFITGFPGFLGSRLVERLAAKYPYSEFALLVQPKFVEQAQQELEFRGLAERSRLIPGDITKMDLGIREGRTQLQMSITRAFHLAAVYDLSIDQRLAREINVDGTRHVLNFLEPCPRLEVFGYVSTAYVSGLREGAIFEDELVHDSGFKNYYEETKYEAEVLVEERKSVIPTVILRPSIVVGDSETGETDKFDGPYAVLRVLRHLPGLTVMTRLGRGTRPVNVVPVDFVTRAMAHLTQPENAGTTFHLTDPEALSAQEMVDIFLDLLDKRATFVSVPVPVARLAAGTPAGMVLGLTPEIVDYFDHPAYYDSSRTQKALIGSGITCPRFADYAPHMLDYMLRHEQEKRTAAMY